MIPRLHVVTNRDVLQRDSFRDVCARVMSAGEGRVAVHIRGGAMGGGALFACAAGVLEEAAGHDVQVVVNDRVDVAAALSLPVHLGQQSLPPEAVARIGRSVPFFGVSVHGEDEARAAEVGGAAYVFVGTIFRSRSHPGRSGAGEGLIAGVGQVCALPMVGIGGITPGNVEAVVSGGAHGVAAISGIWDADDPAAAVTAYLAAIHAAVEG